MTYRLTNADNQSTKTRKTILEIEVLRQETVSEVVCRCGRKSECRTVEITPPAAVGSAVKFNRVPDGWWVHGSSFFSIKATCPECFEAAPSGVLAVKEDEE